MPMTRRTMLASFLAATALPVVCGDTARAAPPPSLELTPACGADHEPTSAQTEGPYFKPNSPLRQDLAADGVKGERIVIAGLALDVACRPLPKTLLQIWHADAGGAYDNTGYTFRGHSFTDADGRWCFATVVPGLYPGRTRHYHFKVQKPGGRVLTTQLYFPDEPGNRRDGLFDERLLLRVTGAADGKFGRFDFML